MEQAQNALRAEETGIGRNLLAYQLKGEIKDLGQSVVKRLKVFLRFHKEIGKISVEHVARAVEQAAKESFGATVAAQSQRSGIPAFNVIRSKGDRC